ncbi:DUF2459 domain-containing protein [Gemmobacter serpentinus]|uniref:DUF2459 domain-containing protein n=1 Tax=Gemmobacter serpentinus TaxID=2652247 RepID=UPI00124C860C|nr:DUF2459 domain-containing protein [Gemmobacter serpentinus]
MRITGRGLALTLAAPFVIALLWFLAGFAGALLPGTVTPRPGPEAVEIRLIGTAIHYDIALPLTPETRARFGFAASDGVLVQAPDAEWLLVGWGARGFYATAGSFADVPWPEVARAVIGDSSVIRLEAWRDFPLDALPDARRIHLSEAGFTALLDRIGDELGPRPALDSARDSYAFYRARSRFSALHTCNTWVGAALRDAGVPLGAWTPTTQALRLSLWAQGPKAAH